MSEQEFYDLLTENWPSIPKSEAKVAAKVAAKIKPAAPRLCALGKKCLRAKNNRAAEVTGRADYCSSGCRARAAIIAKAKFKTLPEVQPQDSAGNARFAD